MSLLFKLVLETAVSIIQVFASLQNRTHTCDTLFNMRPVMVCVGVTSDHLQVCLITNMR